MTELFQLALYEHAVSGIVPARFTQADLAGAVKDHGRAFWRR